MKIFLTGATGFIGSYFLNRCLQNNIKVYALKRPGSLSRVHISGEPIWIDGDLNGDYHEVLAEVDVVVHLAAHSANFPYDSIAECLYWNLNASFNLIQQARNAGVNKFLIAGTCFEYGLTSNQYQKIPPSAPTQPISSYPISKATASLVFVEYAKEFSLQLQILRIFQVYGEGELQTRFWPSLKRAALNGDDFLMTAGSQIRDFINVLEVAEKIYESLSFDDVISGHPLIKNIGTGEGKSILEFAEFWWSYWGATGVLKPNTLLPRTIDLPRIVADIHTKHIF